MSAPRIFTPSTVPAVRLFSRRAFLGYSAAATIAVAAPASPSWFRTRGVVLVPSDLTLTEWPARAARAGLTHIALHTATRLAEVTDFTTSEAGRRFLTDCARLGLQVEYEVHAMSDLLPRKYFANAPAMFRENSDGRRVEQFNCCPSSSAALEVIAENAVVFARRLKPRTHRYFFWPDDGREWCRCARCWGLSASDQALLVENHILGALRTLDAAAQLAHLAYAPTIEPPKQVKPAAGVFLEFAPIRRAYDRPYVDQSRPDFPDRIELLDANLAVFGAADAQVLEYWLDVSRFSSWKRPAKKLPWRREVFLADLEAYRKRGLRHVTSFAVFIDAEYRRLHGELDFLDEYGQGLLEG